MTAQQAIEFSESLDFDLYPPSSGKMTDQELVWECFHLVKQEGTFKKAQKRALKLAAAWQRTDQKCHDVWYPHWLQIAAFINS